MMTATDKNVIEVHAVKIFPNDFQRIAKGYLE